MPERKKPVVFEMSSQKYKRGFPMERSEAPICVNSTANNSSCKQNTQKNHSKVLTGEKPDQALEDYSQKTLNGTRNGRLFSKCLIFFLRCNASKNGRNAWTVARYRWALARPWTPKRAKLNLNLSIRTFATVGIASFVMGGVRL